MTGGGLHSVAWASVITLDSTSVITLGHKHESEARPRKWSRLLRLSGYGSTTMKYDPWHAPV